MKVSLLVLFFLGGVFNPIVYSQGNPGHWRLGGNPTTGVDGVNGSNNRLGTIPPNIPLRIISAGQDRILVEDNSPPAGGYPGGVGIGNVGGGFTPASTVHIHGVAGLVDPVLRLTSPATGPTAGDGFGIGIAFNQQKARPVLFSTQRQNPLT